ncbi:asparagine synthase (glutamine-hydrolyzing) [Sphingomonas koreensis]|uniref:asparagine synthase (glutamine-hydrolyzing) n=1 Tax=Sphingomonas koreensis TaxID=93064 RepID=A0A2M8WFS9_9SPHN|nr:asparagine synthase (glutamine-hydrolyzing) [Sphingomonas koreensis]PJI89799.1 asparagine synthase (glutamine-hydrolysing) [Sphingomonas koreensis]RSU61913.1 asparagine synthase (glutamine-hydrolyzing) [Sphingomonas koreensis]RSU70567.1 asparagine synthase (glutamine-hydrolyzing) [Sphingomonas koreensis]RSY81964.1 asparagine synthase (glutamine-hydrolyzing) [Sphingomonas koreensis]
MCGIAGVASRHELPRSGWLGDAVGALHHRGPDDTGQWWSPDGRVGLAQARLAIIDLSPGGHQPMHREADRLSVVFNGEIYNFRDLRAELEGLGHVFRSHSDTEVLLAAYAQWGIGCLTRLNGMFAFAIFDARANKVYFARDRAGEKPLFYHAANGTIHFASELKTLLADPTLPRVIDPAALDGYLLTGYVPGDGCILAGYRKLPPGHAMELDLSSGAHRVWRYWNLPDYAPVEDDDAGLLGELEALLEDAVGRQLVADVPVGVLLSGGVDSSLITAMAVRNAAKVRTFTIGFAGAGPLNEIEHARLIADHFGTEQVELMAEPTVAELLPRLAAQFDEPMADSSMFPTFMVSELVRQHCTVALGGDGGDELFGGYGHYSQLLALRAKVGAVPGPLRSLAARTAETLLPLGFRGRNWLKGLDVDFRHGLPLPSGFFDAASRRKLLGGAHPITAEADYRSRIPAMDDLLQRATRTDFGTYLSEDILVKVDRTSMLTSLEVRAPFLDHRLIEFAFGKVPSRLKATASDKKILLKQLAARVLPPQFDRQRKQGFSIPLADWLKAGPFREMFWSVLTDCDCLFDRRAVQALLDGQDAGRSNGDRLFALAQFELWRRAYGIGG